MLCEKYFSYQKVRDRKQKDGSPTKGVSKILDLKTLLIPQAFAAYYFKGYVLGKDTDCSYITNSEAYEVLKQDEDLKIYNELIQKQMDLLKLDVTQKLRKKFPACDIDVIDVPEIFFGGAPVKLVSGDVSLPAGMEHSVFPNPANAISVNDSVISPEPANTSFKNYLIDEYKKRNLQAEFVDTFDYGHQGQGNLHCATTTIHICKPRDSK